MLALPKMCDAAVIRRSDVSSARTCAANAERPPCCDQARPRSARSTSPWPRAPRVCPARHRREPRVAHDGSRAIGAYRPNTPPSIHVAQPAARSPRARALRPTSSQAWCDPCTALSSPLGTQRSRAAPAYSPSPVCSSTREYARSKSSLMIALRCASSLTSPLWRPRACWI